MLKISFLKFLDRWIGRPLALLLPGAGSSLPRPSPGAILLIRPGGIGDAVLLVPVIHALRRHLPQAVIEVLAEKRNAAVFRLCSGLRFVYRYDHPPDLLTVFRNRYDVVIDTEQWHRLSAIVARLIRAPVKIGFATNERARLFTHPVLYRQDDYEIDAFLRLIEPLEVAACGATDAKWLQISADDRRQASERLGTAGLQDFVVLFPGASIEEKRWENGRFRALAKWCLNRNVGVVLVGGDAELALGEEIASDLGVFNLIGKTSLGETAAIIEKARLVVSGDSSVLHIAAGLGRPTVALFGPSSVLKWAPRGPRHIVLHKDLPCSPCTRFGYTPPCPVDARCMKDITVENVTSAIGKLLTLQPELRIQ